MSRIVWLIEMKYLTSIDSVNNMILFDFEYLFNQLLNNERERQKEDKS